MTYGEAGQTRTDYKTYDVHKAARPASPPGTRSRARALFTPQPEFTSWLLWRPVSDRSTSYPVNRRKGLYTVGR
jgi:hypothetical protein